MRKTTLSASILAAALCLLVQAAPAQAQATRTWVSGLGDDANPCSRTAPCKTFAGAFSRTATNGLINCIDAGGFGVVTLTRSMTIDCKNVQAGVLGAGTNGITINGASIVVNLRGLSIEGFVTGLIGVNFIQGAVLNIEHSTIFGWGSGLARGISVTVNGGTSKLFVSDTSILSSGTGLDIEPIGAASVVATLYRVKIANNGTGILSSNAAGTSIVLMHESTVNGNTTGCSSLSSGVITSFSSNNLSGNTTTQCLPTNTFPPQ